MTAALFQLQRSNIKSTDPATNRLVPIGTQRTNGIEFTFTGELPHGWQVWSGYSFLDARMTSSIARDDGQSVQGKRPTLTPRHSGNVWLTKSLGRGLDAGAGLNGVAARFANPGNSVTLPGYLTADAMLRYRTARVDLQINVTNLFDREYIVAGHGGNKNLNLPGAPRAVQLTMRSHF